MTTIDIKENPTLELLLALVARGEEVILTDGEISLARVTSARRRFLGLMPGSMTMSDDFDAPLPDEFWLGGE